MVVCISLNSLLYVFPYFTSKYTYSGDNVLNSDLSMLTGKWYSRDGSSKAFCIYQECRAITRVQCSYPVRAKLPLWISDPGLLKWLLFSQFIYSLENLYPIMIQRTLIYVVGNCIGGTKSFGFWKKKRSSTTGPRGPIVGTCTSSCYSAWWSGLFPSHVALFDVYFSLGGTSTGLIHDCG